jgi:hypothetical protein
MSKTYSDKLKDPRWQRMRLEVMRRDEFKCRDCGDAKSTLHVHHCFYEKGDPWDTGANFLLTLCDSCHESRGSLEIDAKRMLSQILVRLKVCGGVSGNDLRAFVSSMAQAAAATDYDPPMVVSSGEWDHETSVRWYLYAVDHPKFRPGYEEITGFHPNWSCAETGEKSQNNSNHE